MPLDTREYDLDAAVERLTEDMEAAAERQAEAPVGSDAAEQAAQRGQRAERLRSGVRWAVEAWDAESVALAALTNGERRRVLDTVDDTGWNMADCYVAAGTYEAPYLEHDPEAVVQEDYEDTVLNVVDLHPAFVDWAESRVRDLGRMGDEEGKSYRALVLEKRLQGSSQTENG